MDKQEFEEEVTRSFDRSFDQSLVKAVPFGNLLTIGISLVAAALSWGVNTAKVSNVEENVRVLMARDITPGAASQLSAIRARDDAQDRQIIEMREEMHSSRQEIISELRFIRDDLRQHMDK